MSTGCCATSERREYFRSTATLFRFWIGSGPGNSPSSIPCTSIRTRNCRRDPRGPDRGKPAVSAAGGILWWRGGRSAAGGTLIGDDLAQVFDALCGEGGHAVL